MFEDVKADYLINNSFFSEGTVTPKVKTTPPVYGSRFRKFIKLLPPMEYPRFYFSLDWVIGDSMDGLSKAYYAIRNPQFQFQQQTIYPQ